MVRGSAVNAPPPFVLSDHFCCGVKQIDDEHAALIDILNAALEPGRDVQALADLLHRFAIGFLQHCQNEEAYLRASGYTRIDEHARHHGDLNGHVAACRRSAGNELAAQRQAVLALRDALVDHILYDLQYKSHLDHTHGR